MTREERNTKLKHFITCLKCEVSGKKCDDNCSVQYEAGNMGEIIENLEAISKALEQEPCEMTAEEYRQRMIQAFHNADCDELIAICALPTEKEFEHLEWLLKKHYKKEPCEDAISRQAVLDLCDSKDPNYKVIHFKEDVECLPPVNPLAKDYNTIYYTPQPKTGHWITLKDEYGDVHEAVCSNCDSNGNHKWVYCPYCGMKMSEIPTGSDDELYSDCIDAFKRYALGRK